MVEVFKTNVRDPEQSEVLLKKIHSTFRHYRANFDLEDCDRILRVECTGTVQPFLLIEFLKNMGYCAEVLSGEEVMN